MIRDVVLFCVGTELVVVIMRSAIRTVVVPHLSDLSEGALHG